MHDPPHGRVQQARQLISERLADMNPLEGDTWELLGERMILGVHDL